MAKKKANKTRNPFYQKITDFLHKKRGKSYKSRELSRVLQVKKSDYHLFREALQELVRSGKIAKLKGGRYTSPSALQKVRGVLQMTRKGFAFVTDERTGEDIFIAASNLNTALDQDLVEVQLFGVSRGRNKEGRVLQVIERSKTTFVGTYHKSEYYGFVVPDNPKIYRDFYIPDAYAGKAKNGQKVLVEMTQWDSSQLNPQGRIVEILGYPDEPGVDVSSVALSFGLPLKFSRQVEEEAAQIRLNISPEEVARRLDLRDEIVFTIDPEDAKDFDDAVSLEKLENGNYRLGVHIADVSHFVKEGSKLDEEAMRRGTSVYLVDRVIPMLPEHLSNQLCSLQPHEDRLTFSCIMEITPEGEVVKYDIRESIINSKRRFTYEEVQAILDDENSTDPFAPVLREMHRLSRILRERRFRSGSIDFDTPEVKFVLDEAGRPVDIVPLQRLHSHEMIEEFMLMANQTVARHVVVTAVNGKPYPLIYRVHEKPDQEKLKKFREFLHALGYRIPIRSKITPSQFQSILRQIEGEKDEVLVKEVALRTMMKAVYSPNNIGHFGLAFEHYTHFTSPIRRYPDLVVHRLLKEYRNGITSRRKNHLKKQLKRICQLASERERVALEAERESVRIKQVEWINEHRDQVFEGLISGVTSFGIFVETIPYLIEGLVRIERLDDDLYIFDEKTYTLIGKEFGRQYRLGDSVKVKVASVDLERNEVDFMLVTEEA
ncbi:MAG: ribonuclease R [Calditrichaeota bacterium]|nr:MAG: ribonuclease R [Calditrichota bacterium]